MMVLRRTTAKPQNGGDHAHVAQLGWSSRLNKTILRIGTVVGLGALLFACLSGKERDDVTTVTDSNGLFGANSREPYKAGAKDKTTASRPQSHTPQHVAPGASTYQGGSESEDIIIYPMDADISNKPIIAKSISYEKNGESFRRIWNQNFDLTVVQESNGQFRLYGACRNIPYNLKVSNNDGKLQLNIFDEFDGTILQGEYDNRGALISGTVENIKYGSELGLPGKLAITNMPMGANPGGLVVNLKTTSTLMDKFTGVESGSRSSYFYGRYTGTIKDGVPDTGTSSNITSPAGTIVKVSWKAGRRNPIIEVKNYSPTGIIINGNIRTQTDASGKITALTMVTGTISNVTLQPPYSGILTVTYSEEKITTVNVVKFQYKDGGEFCGTLILKKEEYYPLRGQVTRMHLLKDSQGNWIKCTGTVDYTSGAKPFFVGIIELVTGGVIEHVTIDGVADLADIKVDHYPFEGGFFKGKLALKDDSSLGPYEGEVNQVQFFSSMPANKFTGTFNMNRAATEIFKGTMTTDSKEIRAVRILTNGKLVIDGVQG